MGVQKCCGQESCTENDQPPKNDRRCQLINEVKELIGNIEHEEKVKPRLSRRPERAVQGMRDLEDECSQWRKRRETSPPLITKIALHETRPTSDYTNMRHENSSQVTYVDATKEGQEWRKTPPAPWDLPRIPSQELRAGNLYVNCDCLKRNGLQHDCPRWECGGRPECVAVNPGPCCVPSKWPKPIRGDRRFGNRPLGVKLADGFGKKELKTGPLNPEVCIPLSSQQGPQGTSGSPGGPGVLGFIGGGRIPQPGMMEYMTIGHIQVPGQGVQFQNLKAPGNQTHQVTQTPQGRGGDVMVMLDLGQLQHGHGQAPGVTSATISSPMGFQGGNYPQTPQNQDASRGLTLEGPGVTCRCRPIQSAPAY